MKQISVLVLSVVMLASSCSLADELTEKKPNVLFVAVDDLNDWVGFLGGHPQAITPNLDRLAKSGTAFVNAHCQAPLCNPSRTSVLTGLRPTTTGIYSLAPSIREVPALKGLVSLPQYFSQNGYTTYSAGKVWHQHQVHDVPTPETYQGEFDVLAPKINPSRPFPPEKLVNTPCPWKAVDWGTFPHEDSERHDYQCASWAIERLAEMPADQPFFMSVGFFFPHIPCVVSQKWFDLYPEDVTVPSLYENDRSDTPRSSWFPHWKLPEPRLKWMRENNQVQNFARSYLAAISFMDAQLGRILDALEQGPFSENTLIVLWSDHGYHLGEKEITGKNSLWDESTRVPLVFAGTGIPSGQTVARPVELLDIYPTLIQLAGLPAKNDLDGISVLPQINNPESPRSRPAITTAGGPGHHSVRTERYLYIRYGDGAEELYDVRNDPDARNNLSGNPEFNPVKAELKQWLPSNPVNPAPGSKHRLSEFRDDVLYWNSVEIPSNTPIPGIEAEEQYR